MRGEQVGLGGAADMVMLNGLGPALPVVLVAVMFMVLVPPVGVPEKKPPVLNVAHAGRLVPLHVIGLVPFAVN